MSRTRKPYPLSLILLLATLPLAAAGAVSASDSPSRGRPAAEAPTWHGDLASARKEAERLDRLIYVDLFAEWCGWCHVLEEKVFPSPEFRRLAEDFVLVRLDVEDGAEGSRVQRRHQAFNLPTALLLDASGALVGKVEGYAEAPRYVRQVERQLESYRRTLDLYRRLMAMDGVPYPNRMYSLAETLHREGDGERAGALYRRLLEAGWQPPEGEAMLVFQLADALRLSEELERAAEMVERARSLALASSENGERREQMVEAIDLLGVQIATDAGGCDRREEALRSFLEEHPDSTHGQRVQRSLEALEQGQVQCG